MGDKSTKLGDYFWEQAIDPIQNPKPVGHFHKVDRFRDVENEAGAPGQEYFAVCGAESQSWYYQISGISNEFGDLEKALASGEVPCHECFKPDDIEFQRYHKK